MGSSLKTFSWILDLLLRAVSLYLWCHQSLDPGSIFLKIFYYFTFGSIFYFFKKFIYFIYLFLTVLGLRCCARAFSSCGERGLLFVAVCGLLIAVASLVVEHGL